MKSLRLLPRLCACSMTRSQFIPERVLTSSATPQIHSSRLHRCFAPCMQRTGSRSSGERLTTVVPARVTDCK